MGALPSALSQDFEVVAPVHPGFAGTPRPEWHVGIHDIALSYLREHERISGTVLLNAVGINVEGIELADFFSLTPQELVRYSFHDLGAAPDPTQLPQETRDIQAGHAATLAVYAREPYMHDPKLRRRLALVPTPVAAIWGESLFPRSRHRFGPVCMLGARVRLRIPSETSLRRASSSCRCRALPAAAGSGGGGAGDHCDGLPADGRAGLWRRKPPLKRSVKPGPLIWG
jgi:hypothetical protein